jgi:predicted methyltransferase
MESQTNVYGTLLENLRRRGIVERPDGEGSKEKGTEQSSVGDQVLRIAISVSAGPRQILELSAETKIDVMKLAEIVRGMERASLVKVSGETIEATPQGEELASLSPE